MSNLVKYGGWTEDQMEEEEADLGSSTFYTFKPGPNVIRVIPPPPGQSPFIRYRQHYVENPAWEHALSFVCFKHRVPKEVCPVCSIADRLHRTGNATDKKRAEQLSPRRTLMTNVIVRSRAETGPMIVRFGKQLFDEMLDLRRNYGDFTHPETGYDIRVLRRGQGKQTKYRAQREDPSPLSSNEMEAAAWIDLQHDLSRYVPNLSRDEVMKKLAEVGGGGSQESSRATAARPGRSKSTAEDDFIDVGGSGDGWGADDGDDEIPWS